MLNNYVHVNKSIKMRYTHYNEHIKINLLLNTYRVRESNTRIKLDVASLLLPRKCTVYILFIEHKS